MDYPYAKFGFIGRQTQNHRITDADDRYTDVISTAAAVLLISLHKERFADL